MKRIIGENGKLREDMLHVFAQEKEQFRLAIRKEIDGKHKAVKELRRC